MTDFVLLHGTTQSPRGWDRLVAELGHHGHSCYPVDLVGGEPSYARYVRAQVPSAVTQPVVVAHSGAGLVLPAVARTLGAVRQVWLAAVVPDGQRSLVDEVRAAPTEMFNPEWVGQDPTTDPVLATYFLFHDADLDTLRWALDTVRLFLPDRLYHEPVQPTTDIPSSYIVCSADRTLRPDWSRREASRRVRAELVELDAGHCPHVSRPAHLAELLTSLW